MDRHATISAVRALVERYGLTRTSLALRLCRDTVAGIHLSGTRPQTIARAAERLDAARRELERDEPRRPGVPRGRTTP